MAKNTPKGKVDANTKQLLAEDEATATANAELHERNVAEEAAKLAQAHEESDNQAPPVAEPAPLPNKEREAAWKAHVEAYIAANPVKGAAKKKRGEFDKIPEHFTGRDVLKSLQLQAMPGK